MQSHTEKVIPTTLIAGDGIGPEIVEATVIVLDALRAPFAWEAHKSRDVGSGSIRGPAASSHAGQHPTHPAGAKRAADHAGTQWLSLRERVIARGVSSLRQRASSPHPGVGRALRKHRRGVGARESRGFYIGFERYIPIDDDPHAVAIGYEMAALREEISKLKAQSKPRSSSPRKKQKR